MTRQPRDLEAFKELSSKKIPWADRVDVIRRQFPSVASMDWRKLFDQDRMIMGRIVGDILKVDQAPPGRVGKRAALDQKTAEQRFRQLLGQDYSFRPFHETFKGLVGNRSLRGVGARIGVSHTFVRRLLHNEAQPDAALMERIAVVFKKSPEYFVEYRVAYVLGVLATKLDSSPEESVALFRKLKAAA